MLEKALTKLNATKWRLILADFTGYRFQFLRICKTFLGICHAQENAGPHIEELGM